MDRCTRCHGPTLLTPRSVADTLARLRGDLDLGQPKFVALQMLALETALISGECAICAARPHQPSGRRCQCGALNRGDHADCVLCGAELPQVAA